MSGRLLAAALAAALAVPAGAEQLVLTNGDRVSGRITLRGKTSIRLRTPYGTLNVPRTKIATIVADDGTEETITAAPAVPPAPPRAPARLEVEVRGDAFWYAWDPRSAPEGTELVLRVKFEDGTLATWVDAELDPGEIGGALVNAFAFTDEMSVRAAEGVEASPPDTAGGRAMLRLTVPPPIDSGLLRISYLARTARADEEPFEIAFATVPVALVPGRVTLVHVSQSRGEMEWSRKRMRGTQTFGLKASAEAPAAP
jgi:hypothetical protein